MWNLLRCGVLVMVGICIAAAVTFALADEVSRSAAVMWPIITIVWAFAWYVVARRVHRL